MISGDSNNFEVPHFAAQNSHGHAKEFLRKLSII
jgi:hypothetical protein